MCGLDNANAVAKTILQSVYFVKFHFTAVSFLEGIDSRIEHFQLFLYHLRDNTSKIGELRDKENKIEGNTRKNWKNGDKLRRIEGKIRKNWEN